MANASSDHHPNYVPGMLIIIKPKQPNLPICSATSINLLLHLFSKPSLHLIAKIILGIIMTAIIISPNIFSQSIYFSSNPDLLTSFHIPIIPQSTGTSLPQLWNTGEKPHMSEAFSGLSAKALGFGSLGTESETKTKNPRNPKISGI